MIRQSTLHLSSNEKSSSQKSEQSNPICSLYSLTRNSLSNLLSRSSGRIMKHQTHTKKGQVTLYGLSKGYIQASPHYPTNSLHLTGKEGDIYIQGSLKSGQFISVRFTKLKDARRYLAKTI